MSIRFVYILFFFLIYAGESTAGERIKTSSPVKYFALVLGVNNTPNSELKTLQYADDDALAFFRLFEEVGYGAEILTTFDQKTLEREGGEQLYPRASYANLMQAVERIFNQMQIAKQQGYLTEFVFAYSGHGDVEKGEGYIVLDGSRFKRKDLFEHILSRSPADQNHVIVDACKSYFFAMGKGYGGEEERLQLSFTTNLKDDIMRKTGFILSTSSAQDSHEWGKYEAGIFSHEVRSALRGAADINGDGAIAYGELGAFLEIANQSIINERLRPDFLVIPPLKSQNTPNFKQNLMVWHDNSSLHLDKKGIGHIYVENEFGKRLLDLHPSQDTRVSLHLPQQRPLFLHEELSGFEYIIKTDNPAYLSQLESQNVQINSKGAQGIAFELLFNKSFKEKDLKAYLQGYSLVNIRQSTEKEIKTQSYALLRGIISGLSLLLPAVATLSFGAFSVERRLSSSEMESQLEARKRNNMINLAFWGTGISGGLLLLSSAVNTGYWLYPVESE